jgi:hypothetical protein
MQPPFQNAQVATVFARYAPDIRDALLKLRALIFSRAERLPAVGALTETLKWGQPAYLTNASGSGSTLRLDALRKQPGKFAIYFHCQTTLVHEFREAFSDRFQYEGNRALIFDAGRRLPQRELGFCIDQSLTYHLRKRAPRLPIGLQIKN